MEAKEHAVVPHAKPAFVCEVQAECFMNCELLFQKITAEKAANNKKTGESFKSSQRYYKRYKVDGYCLYGNCLRKIWQLRYQRTILRPVT
jgi:hypothetical protein